MSNRTIAILVPTLSWSWHEDQTLEPTAPAPRRAVAMESMRWQELSAEAGHAELYAYPLPIRRTQTWNGVKRVIEPRAGTPPREQNRILEIHGLMGAIGEQLAMGWTAEQDAQLLAITAARRDELSNRLMLRAQCELVGHFVLGATHSLANLALRALLLNSAAAASLETEYKVAGFPPGSDERTVWPTFGRQMAQRLRRAGRASGRPKMVRLAEAVCDFRTTQAYTALDGRRGMDYHRRRPQSIAHTAPRGGTVSTANGETTLTMVGPRLEAEASADGVHDVVTVALEALASCMQEVRAALPDAVRGEGINYIYDFDERL